MDKRQGYTTEKANLQAAHGGKGISKIKTNAKKGNRVVKQLSLFPSMVGSVILS